MGTLSQSKSFHFKKEYSDIKSCGTTCLSQWSPLLLCHYVLHPLQMLGRGSIFPPSYSVLPFIISLLIS